VTKAVLVAGLFVWLMGFRLIARQRWPVNLASLACLSVIAALATAGVEALWYAIGTGIQANLILAANLDFDVSIRPAWWVLGAGLVATALFGGRQWLSGSGERTPRQRVRTQIADSA
jgi:sulfoxide reductase heme-binding subunit YedZ